MSIECGHDKMLLPNKLTVKLKSKIAEKLKKKITSFPFENCLHSLDCIDCHLEQYGIVKV